MDDSIVQDTNAIKKQNELNPGKILIVDDEALNFEIIKGYLMVLGFQNSDEKVDYVNNGKSALELL